MTDDVIKTDDETTPETDGLVRIPDNVLVQHVSDEVVFLNLDSSTYYGLDPIGTRMLDLAMEHDDFDAVIETLESEYDTTPDILRRDLRHLISELESEGLVIAGDGTGRDAAEDDPAEDDAAPE